MYHAVTLKTFACINRCRVSCGNNIHAKCMSLYAQHNISTGKRGSGTVLCPLCRADWGPMALNQIKEDCKTSSELKHACASVSCSQCKINVRNTFYRCIECSLRGDLSSSQHPLGDSTVRTTYTPADFCQRCYESSSSGHARHHFIKADAKVALHDHAWEPVIKAANISSDDLIANLQSREFTAADYDLLLSLDASTKPSLVSVIVEAMPIYTGIQTTCCWCTGSGAGSRSAGNSFSRKVSCCGVGVHETCLIQALNEAISDSHSKISAIKCPNSSCNKRIFGGLSRSKRSRKRPEIPKPESTGSSISVLSTSTRLLPQPMNGIDGVQLQISSTLSFLPNKKAIVPKTIRRGLMSSSADRGRLQPLLHSESLQQESLSLLDILPLSNKQTDNLSIIVSSHRPPRSRVQQRFSVRENTVSNLDGGDNAIDRLGAFGHSILSIKRILNLQPQISQRIQC